MDVNQSGKSKALRKLRIQQETPKTLIQRWTQEIQNESQPQFFSPDTIFSQEQEAQRKNKKQSAKKPKLDITLQETVPDLEKEDAELPERKINRNLRRILKSKAAVLSSSVDDSVESTNLLNKNNLRRKVRSMSRAVAPRLNDSSLSGLEPDESSIVVAKNRLRRRAPARSQPVPQVTNNSALENIEQSNESSRNILKRRSLSRPSQIVQNSSPSSLEQSDESLTVFASNNLKRRALPKPRQVSPAINNSASQNIDQFEVSLNVAADEKSQRRASSRPQPVSPELNILPSQNILQFDESLNVASDDTSKKRASGRAQQLSLAIINPASQNTVRSDQSLNVVSGNKIQRTSTRLQPFSPAINDTPSQNIVPIDESLNVASGGKSQKRVSARPQQFSPLINNSASQNVAQFDESLNLVSGNKFQRRPSSRPQPFSPEVNNSASQKIVPIVESLNVSSNDKSHKRASGRPKPFSPVINSSAPQNTVRIDESLNFVLGNKIQRQSSSRPKPFSPGLNNLGSQNIVPIDESLNVASSDKSQKRASARLKPFSPAINDLPSLNIVPIDESLNAASNDKSQKRASGRPKPFSPELNPVKTRGNVSSSKKRKALSPPRPIVPESDIREPDEDSEVILKNISKKRASSSNHLPFSPPINNDILENSEESGIKLSENMTQSRRLLRSGSMYKSALEQGSLFPTQSGRQARNLRTPVNSDLMKISSPIGTSKLLKHLVFTPKHARKVDESVRRTPRLNKNEIMPEIEAILDHFDDKNLRTEVPKKTRTQRKPKVPPRETLFLKSDAIYEFERFSGLKLSRQAVPFLMEALEKFNRVGLNRLQNILLTSGRTKAGLVDIKQILQEAGLFSKYEGKFANHVFFMDLVKILPWEVRSKVVPGLGTGIPENAWDEPPRE